MVTLLAVALAVLNPPVAGQVPATSAVSHPRFVDVLQTPAQKSPLAQRTLLLAVAHAGKRLIAVGLRGHILYSTDAGNSWTQANVPVSSDLTAVWMASETKAWVVGHDGVILHSSDGGLNWTLQLDGRQAIPRILADLQRQNGLDKSSARIKLLEEAKRYASEGPIKPLLGVWFADENTGFAVGAYNLIFYTSDAGKTWESWFDRTDNPQFLHFNAIHGDQHDVVLAGEMGLILKFDAATRRFVNMKSPYNGSFFDVKTWNGEILAVGMRGNAWRYAAGKWGKLDMPVRVGLAGLAAMPDGRIVIASQTGALLVSHDGGRQFATRAEVGPMVLSGLVATDDDHVVVTGSQGIRVEALK